MTLRHFIISTVLFPTIALGQFNRDWCSFYDEDSFTKITLTKDSLMICSSRLDSVSQTIIYNKYDKSKNNIYSKWDRHKIKERVQKGDTLYILCEGLGGRQFAYKFVYDSRQKRLLTLFPHFNYNSIDTADNPTKTFYNVIQKDTSKIFLTWLYTDSSMKVFKKLRSPETASLQECENILQTVLDTYKKMQKDSIYFHNNPNLYADNNKFHKAIISDGNIIPSIFIQYGFSPFPLPDKVDNIFEKYEDNKKISDLLEQIRKYSN